MWSSLHYIQLIELPLKNKCNGTWNKITNLLHQWFKNSYQHYILLPMDYEIWTQLTDKWIFTCCVNFWGLFWINCLFINKSWIQKFGNERSSKTTEEEIRMDFIYYPKWWIITLCHWTLVLFWTNQYWEAIKLIMNETSGGRNYHY